MYIINANWRIDTDIRNVILQRKKVNARGKRIGTERWENIGYYPTHKDALKALVEYEIRIPIEYQAIVDKIEEVMTVIADLQYP